MSKTTPNAKHPVLITRSEPGASRFAERLEKNNIKTITQPLITINPLDFTPPDITAYDALIFTSRHGVTSFTEKAGCVDLPVYTVGDTTAKSATDKGCGKVISAGSSLEELLATLGGRKEHSRLLYIRGQDITGTIPGADELITYEALANPVFDTACQQAIQSGEVAAVTLFSARTAAIYRQTLERYDLLETGKRIPLLSISDSVLECVQDFIHTYSANAPTMDAMEDLVLRYVGRR